MSFNKKLKKILFYCVIILSTHPIIGQDFIVEFGVRVKDPEDVLGTADTNGNLAYFFDGHRQFQATIINSDNQIEKNISINKVYISKKDKLIGISLSDNYFCAFFYNKKRKTLSATSLDRSTGDYKTNMLKILQDNELILRGFEANNSFYILTVEKKTSEITLLETKDGKTVKSKKYKIPVEDFYKIITQKNEMLNTPALSEVGIEVVDSYLDNNLKAGYSKKKLYRTGSNIILTFDDPHGTHFIKIDPQNDQLNYQRLNFNLERGDELANKTGNSFVFDHYILRTTMNSEMMNIAVIDLNNMALVNNYNIFPDAPIPILNGAIKQDNDTEAHNDENEGKQINKTKRYFNRVLDGNIAIIANKLNNNLLEIEVGSYTETVYRNTNYMPSGFALGMGMGVGMGFGYGAGMGGFGNPMMGPGSMFGYPGYYSPYGRPMNQVVRKTVSFKSLLEDKYFNHIDGEMPKTIRDKANKYISDNFSNNPPDIFCVSYRNDESMLLGYYIESKNQFVVLNIDR
ncbi:MAG: hypothetical protein EAZ07_09860 [Cytophagales bacterium]|nr:MAG: hypothetical protein EAZ07_09860 [Cytophagales bacterium]